MKAAYYHPDKLAESPSAKTPMRAALDCAGIDVLDISYSDTGGDVANISSAAMGKAAGIDVWISEACAADQMDRLGPHACKELGIPFVIVEPDVGIAAEDQRDTALEIVGQASHIITTSSATARYLEDLKPKGLTLLSTFVDTGPFLAAHKVRELHKSRFASTLRLAETLPWLLTDGAMNDGDSLRSYEVLSVALSRLVMMDWTLIVVASGNAMPEVRRIMLSLPQDRIRYYGATSLSDFAALCVSCDLYVWPAVGDSSPGSLLEAQSSGLPVVAGRHDSTEDRVIDGRTGRLTPIENAESFAGAISFLLRQPCFIRSFGEGARDTISSQHHLDIAAGRLVKVLADVCR